MILGEACGIITLHLQDHFTSGETEAESSSSLSNKSMKLQNLEKDPGLWSPSPLLQPQAELHLTYKKPVRLTAISYSAKSSAALPTNRYFYEYQI